MEAVVQGADLLQVVELFSDLETIQRNEVASLCDWQRLPKNTPIIDQSETSTDVFFIAEGKVSVKGFSVDGKEVTYTELGKGEIFGEFSALDSMPRSATVVTIEGSFLAHMNAKKFHTILLKHPLVSIKLAQILVTKNRSLTQRLFELSTMAVKHRVCAALLRWIDEEGTASNELIIQPAPTHYQLATMLGTHREAVSKELSNLSSKGIVAVSRNKIHIKDIMQLRKQGMIRI